ncbi:NUDIX hydrolase [Brevundimonas basaltis]|uniref:8-oxo-dGTP pyrophosphatase MutT (NUDIX family) n=1 Tax=Brevundimonas basaltis TaxID=472166 RepID=A0A7W8HWU1_9CAUL|nr:NUDIX hydrolase [Brevundimonas basaltis]MBB5291378.1 8-oxo-dGTP pyrophosphatase MutT (NUDIX family) [Brevundimonas basaltis]
MLRWLRALLSRNSASAKRAPVPDNRENAGAPATPSRKKRHPRDTRIQTAERRQVAALPWRRERTGVEILLITSRETRRWVTPKGGRMSGKTDAEAAAQEALEEAGVEGVIADRPLGSFRYLKVLKRRASRWCVVDVYDLEVGVERSDWKERAERERVWVSRDEAARMVDEPDLRRLIAAFEP